MAHVGQLGHQLLASVIRSLQRCLLGAIGLALSLSSLTAATEPAILEENQGKALLIYNIAKFTVWPPEMVAEEQPFLFAVWSDSPLRSAFRVIEGQAIHKRPVHVQRFPPKQLPAGGKVLIIPGQRLQQFTKAHNTLSRRPILTVTTDPIIFKAGAMVLVEVVNDRLAFSVNLDRVQASGLEISGNLLRHAKEVNF